MSRLGVIGIVTALLAVVGGATYLVVQPDELVNTYICPSNNNVGVFPGGISPSGLTAYIQSGNSSGSKRCSVSWIKCSDYAAQNNFTCLDALPPEPCNDTVSLPSWNLNLSTNQSGWQGYQYDNTGDLLLILTNATSCLVIQ